MLDLCVINSIAYIWNEEAVSVLRQEHRIVGCLLGSLPRNAFQNIMRGLPLQLMPEEATLIVEKGIGHLRQYRRLESPASDEDQKAFESQRKKLYDDQVQLCMEERKRQIMSNVDKIIKGKSKKRKKNKGPEEETPQKATPLEESPDVIPLTEPEDLVRLELAKVAPIPESSSLIQLFTACPWLVNEGEEASWTFPATDYEKRRYLVFKDLWEKGFYLTSGRKFGADFLVYPGDPYAYHASYVATVLSPTESLSALSLVAKGRLANSVRKAALLCSINDSNEVICTSLHWSRIK